MNRYWFYITVCCMSGIGASSISFSAAAEQRQADRSLAVRSIPGTGSLTAGNTAGLLRFCLRGNLISISQLGGSNGSFTSTGPAPAMNVQSILHHLDDRKDTKGTPDYTAGLKGIVQTPDGPFSMSSVREPLRRQLCGLILNRAGFFF